MPLYLHTAQQIKVNPLRSQGRDVIFKAKKSSAVTRHELSEAAEARGVSKSWRKSGICSIK